MRKFSIILFLFFITLPALLSAQGNEFIHTPPAPILIGESLHLELTHVDSRQPVTNVFFFYRMQGEHNFRSQRMQQQGLVLVADVNTAKLFPGNLEYYFAYQDANGNVKYLPAANPEDNPYSLKILPAKSNPDEMSGDLFVPLLLSPNPGDVVASDELLLAFSVPFELDPDKLTYKLLIGGVDVSKLLRREGNLLTFSPKSIRSGLHNAELKIYNESGKLVGKNQLSFTISGKPTKQSAFESATRLFLDNRYETIREQSDNFFRGGLNVRAKYKQMEFMARALVSSEESFNLQPINQYSIGIRYVFNSRNDIYLKGGDISTNYDQLSFWEKRVRGIGVGFHTSYFDFDFTNGQNFRAVEGKTDDQGNITRYGTYEQSFVSFRPQFNFGRHFSWAFNLVNSKDDPKSIVDSLAANPKEALVVGSSMNLNLDNRRILFKGSIQGSIKNSDAAGEAVDFDTLATQYELSDTDVNRLRPFVNFMENTGFLTLTQGLSPMPSLAMQVESQLRYFGHDLRATYKRIDAEFTSPGNPYLRKDIAGFFINDNIRLLKSQVLLNIYYNSFAENLDRDSEKTSNQAFGASLSYFPYAQLPSITLTFGSQSRSNNVDTSSVYQAEDNENLRYGISSTYNLNTGTIRNTLMLNVSKFEFNDRQFNQNNSDFILFSFGVRNRFDFPLTTRINYSQSTTDLFVSQLDTANTLNLKSNQLKTQKFQFGAEYLLGKVVANSDLKPFVNITIQTIKNDSNDQGDYKRNNYSAGIYIRNNLLGNLSLRYDVIDYGDLYDWNDSIFSARYDVNF